MPGIFQAEELRKRELQQQNGGDQTFSTVRGNDQVERKSRSAAYFFESRGEEFKV